MIDKVIRTVEKYQMLPEGGRVIAALSGGSDYHGLNSPNLRIGVGAGGLRVPESLLAPLKERLPKRH